MGEPRAVGTVAVEAPWTDDALGNGHLPRSQVGTNPQHLLVTLLGDYWHGRTEHLPSAAIVELLAEFEISEPSARAALNRLTKRGLLVSSKRGRNTYYGVEPRALPLLQGTFRRIVAFGTHESRPWDGRWTLVAFSIPETQRQLRHAVRTNLRWLGFAALYDGLWCSPWEDQDAVFAKLSELGVGSATVIRAEIDPRSTVQAAVGMGSAGAEGEVRGVRGGVLPGPRGRRRGALTATQALVSRTKVMDEWRTFIGLEPELPSELLPGDWPRGRLHDLAFELHDSLAPIAQARCEQIIAKHAPELAPLLTHQTAAALVS